MHVPSEHHWGAVKHLLRYLNGTRSLGIWLLIDTPLTLLRFFDVDWADNPDDRTFTGAFLIFFLSLIQFSGVLQSNTRLFVFLLRLSIVSLRLLLSNCNGLNRSCRSFLSQCSCRPPCSRKTLVQLIPSLILYFILS